MTYRTIKARLSRASIPFQSLRKSWFRDAGGDMGEYISGLVVASREDYLRAADVLGVDKSNALEKLDAWSECHLPGLEGYPIDVRYSTYFSQDDDGPTDSGSFSILSK